MKKYRAGIDIGSTTVKLVVLDDADEILYGEYRRHQAHTQETLSTLLEEAKKSVGECELQVCITGSGAINLGKALDISFVQEVVAVATALKKCAPQTDVAIELGGEDAKIIYFTGGLEERMNGVCAGGTGSFIDQMASLLQTDAAGLNREAEQYKQIYPIAARCGVFAKTDIQPLINEGATKADLAASIFQAVVNQTISGLACGKPIRGCVAFLGGPLHFLPELKKAFVRTLGLTAETTVDPDHSHLFAAMGAAMESTEKDTVPIDTLIERLKNGVSISFEMPRLPALFESHAEYEQFCCRHARASVARGELSAYRGNCYLGIDAGSTTTKMALIGENGELLYSYYTNNNGNPIEAAKKGIHELQTLMPGNAKIVRACSTGYGEALLQAAFSLDDGEVETIAHCTAASFFDPKVDCVLDIGGQDMKCIRLKNGAVDSIMLNEACSSGCGSFIENFANSLGYTAEEFAQTALFAEHPVDLGTRCTVFMNSNVKQAQKEGASVSDISAGLAYSVIKNALYKVIKLSSAEELGSHIVVQGGTFYNEAVLRAFEKEMGVNVIRPDIAGLMGAYGAALYGKARAGENARSTVLTEEELRGFSQKVNTVQCGGCGNHCQLTVNVFADGKRFISGNRCDKPVTGKANNEDLDLYAYKLKLIEEYRNAPAPASPRGNIGIPLCLNMYELLPFWHTLFTRLGFKVTVSPFSNRKLYQSGQATIPSDTACFPAKLSHGHIRWLCEQGVDAVFYPCMSYNLDEHLGDNHYNCPVVAYYPEVLEGNCPELTRTRLIYDYFNLERRKDFYGKFAQALDKYFPVLNKKDVHAAIDAAYDEYHRHMQQLRDKGAEIIAAARKEGRHIIVLAGRPYHVDPEINHGINQLIIRQGAAVVSEDSVSCYEQKFQTSVLNQWTYHSRLYAAARYCTEQPDMDLVQLVSFGCGLDAVTTDETREILQAGGKLYTQLKIDEITNLGAVNIRLRSLFAALEERKEDHKD